MDRVGQVALAERFRSMHDARRVLLLPNAWDAGSARLFASLGFDAVATTSGGLAWSLGYPDGEHAPLADVLAVVERIVAVCPLPVSVDLEAGYGDSPDEVHANVRAVVAAGAVGVNLEDGIRHVRLREIPDAAQRISAAREGARAAGVPIVVNARIDAWAVREGPGEGDRVDEAVRRASAYRAAGADCVYPIGLADPAHIATLCARIDGPVNIGARAGLPGLAELARLGVARVSVGTRLATVALAAVRDAASAMRDTGSFESLVSSLGHEDADRLFAETRCAQ